MMGFVKIKAKKIMATIFILALLCAVSMPCLVSVASDISNAQYVTNILVSNNGTLATDVFVLFDLSTQNMIDAGMLSGDAEDCTIISATNFDLEFMPGCDRSYWVTYVPSIPANSETYIYLFSKDVTGGDLRYFPGAGGLTAEDDDSMELGNVFALEMEGFVDTSAGDNKNLVYKEDAFRLYISASGSITASILGTACSVTAEDVESGFHTIRVTADGTNLKIYIDDTVMPKDSEPLNSATVDDNENGWVMVANNSMPIVEYVKIWN